MSAWQSASEIDANALAKVFSPGILRDLGRRGKSPRLARLLSEAHVADAAPQRTHLSELFEHAFALTSCRSARHDYTYRAALVKRVLLGTHSLRSACMLWEFRASGCKADVVLLNGSSVAYEIKSERDSLARVQDQVRAYLRVFEKVNLVIGEAHLDRALDLIPEDVGLLTLTDQLRLRTIRHAQANVQRVSPIAIFESLTLSESERVLRELGVSVPVVPNTQRYSALLELFARQEGKDVHDAMVKTLKQTRSLRSMEDILDRVPPSLYALALAARLPRPQWDNLEGAMNSTLSEAMTWS